MASMGTDVHDLTSPSAYSAGNEERSGEPVLSGDSGHDGTGHDAGGDSCGLIVEPDCDIVSAVINRAHHCQSRLQLPEFAALEPSGVIGTSCPDLAADLQVIRV
jgi:hypothetical protein